MRGVAAPVLWGGEHTAIPVRGWLRCVVKLKDDVRRRRKAQVLSVSQREDLLVFHHRLIAQGNEPGIAEWRGIVGADDHIERGIANWERAGFGSDAYSEAAMPPSSQALRNGVTDRILHESTRGGN
jgi:hypothetical protein